MRTTTRIFTLTALTAALLSGCGSSDSEPTTSYTQPTLGYRSATLLTADGYSFKDLNKDSQVNPYEDWRLDSTTRAEDLLARMTLAQKAGLMMHGTLSLNSAGRIDFDAMSSVLNNNYVNTFITRMSGDPATIAADNNTLQQTVEAIGLGIPVTISTDPRNHFTNDPNATSVSAGAFSQWPELLGFAAI